MHEATRHIVENGEILRAEAPVGEEQGLITRKAADLLTESGGLRLMLAQDLGGYEAHPNDFFEWVVSVGENDPSSGWIAGVVGIHPWQISIMDPRLQEEIYGDGRSDTWTSSPYAPFGRAKKVDGGYLFTGRWPFSTGTDYSDWVILGGMVVGDDGAPTNPPDVRHFVLPRSDYEIVPDSWDVSGLRGTGSKDVRMEDVFVPDYRVYEAARMNNGDYGRLHRPGVPLYQLLFGIMFPAAINAGALGIARGAVRAYAEQLADRVTVRGIVSKADPTQLIALAKAESDVEASIAHLKVTTAELFEHVSRGNVLTDEQRLRVRRDHVRAATRAVYAVEELLRGAGSASIRRGDPVDLYRSALPVAATHLCNVPEPVYQNHGVWRFTGELPKGPY